MPDVAVTTTVSINISGADFSIVKKFLSEGYSIFNLYVHDETVVPVPRHTPTSYSLEIGNPDSHEDYISLHFHFYNDAGVFLSRLSAFDEWQGIVLILVEIVEAPM